MSIVTRVLLLATVGLLPGCFGETPEAPETPDRKPEVTVVAIQPWQDATSQALPGIVRPGKRAVLSTRVAGTLLAVETEPGDAVQTGDLLARVDAREVDAAMAAAQANINAAKAAVQQARQNHQRLKRLYDEDLIARVRVERANVKVRELEAQLQAAQSELEAQKVNQSYTRLTAPFNGQVAETLVDEGSFVGPGQPLLVLEARDRLRVDVPVSSQLAASLTPGQLVSVMTDDKTTLPAHLTGVIPALDNEATGQRLRLTLEDARHQLAPGQVVSVLVPRTTHPQPTRQSNWVGVPREALIRRGQLTGVLVVEQTDGSAAVHLKWIKTANPPANGTERIPVTEGLSAGERVVLNPSADLQDGQSVTLTNAGQDNGE